MLKTNTIKWHKIADSLDEILWQPNNLATVHISGRNITLALIKNQLFACAGTCPHASGALANGFVDVLGNIVCPLHKYRFNLVNGRNVSGEGYWLKVYPTEKREAGYFIGLPDMPPIDL